jgi:thioredoxin-like negative regulator of GroEL
MKVKKIAILFFLMALPLSIIIAQNTGKKKSAKKSAKKTAVKKKPVPVKKAKEINWFQGTEIDFENEAHKLRKPAILYIFTDNNEVCTSFYKNVLMDTSIINHVDSNFIAYKLNLEYDSPNAMKYDIDDVPAVILLDRNTQKIDKMEGIHSPVEFKKFLKQVNQ